MELYFGHDVSARAARAMNYKNQDCAGDGTESIKGRTLPANRLMCGPVDARQRLLDWCRSPET